MQLDPYLDALRADLDRATALADEDTRGTAARLAVALETPVRLLLIQALSDAAAQITASLPGALVEVRMAGRDPELLVQAAEPESTPQPADPVPAEPGEGQVRLTLRLPEAVKTRADAAADAAGLSLNAWITDACRAALRPAPPTPDKHRTARRITGWA